MSTPDKARKTITHAWMQVPAHRIVADIGCFIVVLEAIIKAKGAYVSDHDLRNDNQHLMQRLVRGGVVQDNASVATLERVSQELSDIMES